jgi:hypothetical protein
VAERGQRLVKRTRQVRLVALDADGVLPLLQIADHHQPGPLAVTGGDDVVQQDGVGAPLGEVDVGFLHPLVGDAPRACLPQQVPGQGIGQRPHPQPTQRREIAHPRVAGARHQALGEDVVRAGEANASGARGGHLEPIEDDVEGAALERGDQVRPVILHEQRPHPELPGQGGGDLHLESGEAAWPLRILVDVRLSPLDVGAPAQNAAPFYPRQPRGRRLAPARAGRDHEGEPGEALDGARSTGVNRGADARNDTHVPPGKTGAHRRLGPRTNRPEATENARGRQPPTFHFPLPVACSSGSRRAAYRNRLAWYPIFPATGY